MVNKSVTGLCLYVDLQVFKINYCFSGYLFFLVSSAGTSLFCQNRKNRQINAEPVSDKIKPEIQRFMQF